MAYVQSKWIHIGPRIYSIVLICASKPLVSGKLTIAIEGVVVNVRSLGGDLPKVSAKTRPRSVLVSGELYLDEFLVNAW